MAVTDIARIRLKANVSVEDTELRRRLLAAKEAMESYTGNTFYFYTQLDDPSLIYIIGRWVSAAQHSQEWIPSEANQNILVSLKDYISVDWMFHVDMEQMDIPFDAPILANRRYFVSEEEKGTFSAEVERLWSLAAGSVCPYRLSGGWKVEKHENDERHEYLLFSGAKSVAQEDMGQELTYALDRLHNAVGELETTFCKELPL